MEGRLISCYISLRVLYGTAQHSGIIMLVRSCNLSLGLRSALHHFSNKSVLVQLLLSYTFRDTCVRQVRRRMGLSESRVLDIKKKKKQSVGNSFTEASVDVASAEVKQELAFFINRFCELAIIQRNVTMVTLPSRVTF